MAFQLLLLKETIWPVVTDMPGCQGGAQAICAEATGTKNEVAKRKQMPDKNARLIRKTPIPRRANAGWIKIRRRTQKHQRHNPRIDAQSQITTRAHGSPNFFEHR